MITAKDQGKGEPLIFLKGGIISDYEGGKVLKINNIAVNINVLIAN